MNEYDIEQHMKLDPSLHSKSFSLKSILMQIGIKLPSTNTYVQLITMVTVGQQCFGAGLPKLSKPCFFHPYHTMALFLSVILRWMLTS